MNCFFIIAIVDNLLKSATFVCILMRFDVLTLTLDDPNVNEICNDEKKSIQKKMELRPR